MKTTEKIIESYCRYVKEWLAASQYIWIPFMVASFIGPALISAMLVIAPSVGLSASLEEPVRHGPHSGAGDDSFVLWFIAGPLLGFLLLFSFYVPIMLLISIFSNAKTKAEISKNDGYPVGLLSLWFAVLVLTWIILFWFLAHDFILLGSVFATAGIAIGVVCVFLALVFALMNRSLPKSDNR